MRYNKEIQRLADQCAKANGKFAAVYYGRTQDFFVFIPVYSDSQARCEGLPQFIIVNDNVAEYICSLNFCEYDDMLTSRHYPRKGRRMFEAYKRMYEQGFFASKKDEVKIREIVEVIRNCYDQPIVEGDLFTYLEIADRFNMTMSFEPDPYTTDRRDGWSYFIKLKRGKLPQILDIK